MVHISPRPVTVACSRGLRDRANVRPSRHEESSTTSTSCAGTRTRTPGWLVADRCATGCNRSVVRGSSTVCEDVGTQSDEIADGGPVTTSPMPASALVETGASEATASGPTWAQRRVVSSIRWYQRLAEGRLSPCRFSPSCSTYALEACETHGAQRGLWLTLRRLSRCRPLGPSGWDPVPERRDTAREKGC